MEISEERKQKLLDYCTRHNIQFNDINLLNQAFMHKSNSVEYNNERLEFLGDAILETVTVNYIYHYIWDKPVGELSRIKSASVNENTLYSISKSLEISDMLILGKSEELSNGRKTKSILADGVEALIGAYYMDCKNFEQVQKFVESFVGPEVIKITENKGYIDYKSLLQEYCQKRLHVVPKYDVVKHSGPDNARIYWVNVRFKDKGEEVTYGPACGRNKKDAEQNCAKIVCTKRNIAKG